MPDTSASAYLPIPRPVRQARRLLLARGAAALSCAHLQSAWPALAGAPLRITAAGDPAAADTLAGDCAARGPIALVARAGWLLRATDC